MPSVAIHELPRSVTRSREAFGEGPDAMASAGRRTRHAQVIAASIAVSYTHLDVYKRQELQIPYEGPEDNGIATSLFLVDPDGHQLELTAYNSPVTA